MSSTLKQAIQAIKSRIADAYTAIVAKGGTLPATQDSANLASAIASIPGAPDRTKSWFSNGGTLGIGTPALEQYETFSDEGEIWLTSWTMSQGDMHAEIIKRISMLHTNTNGITNLRYAVGGFTNLEEVKFGPYCNFNACTNFTGFFRNCPKLAYLDFSMIKFRAGVSINTVDMLVNDTALKTLRVGSGWDIGIDLSTTGLLHDGLVQFFNDLPTPRNNSQVITIGADKQALLTPQEIAIATDKGWQIA